MGVWVGVGVWVGMGVWVGTHKRVGVGVHSARRGRAQR